MEVSLPGGIALLLECVAKNRQHADLVVLTGNFLYLSGKRKGSCKE